MVCTSGGGWTPSGGQATGYRQRVLLREILAGSEMKLQKFEMRPDWEPTLGTSLERQRSLLNPGGFIGSITATSGPQKFETCPDWGAKTSVLCACAMM